MAGGLVGAIALGGGLSGCVSTQQKNARAKLSATRLLASREPQRVTERNPDVRVLQVAVVRGRRSDAIVVDLRSRAARPLTDVPIAVGVRRTGGRAELLNERGGLDWFQTHVPAIPAGGTATWIFTARTTKVPAGQPFARVGVSPSPALSRAGSLPRIEAGLGAGRPAAAAVRAMLDNSSGIPQYRLQVYAVVRARGRYVAAGKATIEHLGTGERTTVRVPLTGHAPGGAVRVHAIPTIFE
ncbi:MAG: hypothetical protein WBC33_08100 [Conexibacter sp.]